MEELDNLNDLKDKPQLKSIIRDVINEIKEYPFVNAIVLFGSYARNKAKPYSDIDICVITENNISFDEKAKIGSNSSDIIDISIFRDLSPVIRFRVFEDGKLLYCKDSDFLHQIKVRTIKEYLDFRHIIDRYIKRVFTEV